MLPARRLTVLPPPYRFREPEAKTLTDSFDIEPPRAWKRRYDLTVNRLKVASWWDQLDVIHDYAALTAQAARRNWKNPGTHDASPQGSPAFTPRRGYTTNGSSSYLDTQFNIAADGSAASQDSTMLACWINGGADTPSNSDVSVGGNDGTNRCWLIVDTDTGVADAMLARINTSSAADFIGGGSVTTKLGLNAYERFNNSQVRAYKDGAPLGTASQPSSGACNVDLYVGAINSSGSPGSFSNDRFAGVLIGGEGASDAAHATLYDIWRRHWAAIGAA